MSEYQRAVKKLKEAACKNCFGGGTKNDAEPGDTFFNTWTCPKCKGSGFAQGKQ